MPFPRLKGEMRSVFLFQEKEDFPVQKMKKYFLGIFYFKIKRKNGSQE
jgi:hypothetical protein